MPKKPKKVLAITYPGYEDDYKTNGTPSSFERQWQRYQTTLVPSRDSVPSNPPRMRWLWSVTWFLLKTCFYCCIALLFLCALQPHHPSDFDIGYLNKTLRNNVIGQNFAVETTLNIISNYMKSNDFTFPLVLLFVGCSGCGKTYTMSLVSSTYPFTTALVGSHHMTTAHLVRKDFAKEIAYKLSPLTTNVITIDDVVLNNVPMYHQLRRLFDDWEQLVTVKTVPTIFILSLSGGSAIVEDYALLKLRDNEAEDLSELQQEYKQVLPEWMSRFSVVPFVPMKHKHVRECIRRELANMNEGTPEDLVEKILEEMHFYPSSNPIFSDSGCKAVPIKLALTKFSKNSA